MKRLLVVGGLIAAVSIYLLNRANKKKNVEVKEDNEEREVNETEEVEKVNDEHKIDDTYDSLIYTESHLW
ncbi:MAG: hypothetical protein IJ809_02835 [Clostridia bacterium]|nr:hypothetical protein [Clostridia bacterium]